MQLVTVTDAQTALAQLASDLADTQAYITQQVSSGSFALPGTSELASTATSLVTQLENRLDKIDAEMQTGKPLDELTAPQIAELRELQQEVISDRELIGTTISSVDWNFNGIFNDAATMVENVASQAVTGVSSAFGINWTAVAIVLGAVVLFIIYVKVK